MKSLAPAEMSSEDVPPALIVRFLPLYGDLAFSFIYLEGMRYL
jgi:hypothetical protein